MRKILLLVFLLPCFALPSFGVEIEVDTIYYDKEWKGVSNRHFADFYRIIEKNPTPGYPKKFRDFFITGEIQGEGVYETIDRLDDSKTTLGDGEYIVYYKNGQIKVKNKIRNGEPDGEILEFFENGNPMTKGFLQNGRPEGEFINYYENGKIEERYNYKNGELDGLCEFYYETGKIKERSNYKNGEYNGVCESYYENGNLASQGHFKNGKMDGLYTKINEDGLCFQTEYKDDKPAKDFFTVSNKDGLYSRIRISDNTPIYDSPSINDLKIEKDDGNVILHYENDGVVVYVSCQHTNDYGKYHRVYVYIVNNSFTPKLFNPNYTKAILTDKNGNSIALDIQTAQEYSKRIGRTQMWEEGFAAYGENAAAKKSAYSNSTTVTRGSNGKTIVSKTTTYDANAANAAQAQADQNVANLKQANKNMRQSKIEDYVQKVTINPGEVYKGYFNIKRKKDGYLNITLDIGGAKYQFPITVTK